MRKPLTIKKKPLLKDATAEHIELLLSTITPQPSTKTMRKPLLSTKTPSLSTKTTTAEHQGYEATAEHKDAIVEHRDATAEHQDDVETTAERTSVLLCCEPSKHDFQQPCPHRHATQSPP